MAKSDVEKQLDEEQKARDKANAAAQRVMDDARPTPTQREIDLAKLGHHVDDKEPDGTPEQDLTSPVNRSMEAAKTDPAYKTK